MIRIRQSSDKELVDALHVQLLPGDEVPRKWDAAWVAWDCDHDQACGFATARLSDRGTSVFLQRSAVMPYARGHRLQRRFLRAREGWARQCGAGACVTYTMYTNYPSIVNLVKAGYRFYDPQWAWAGREVHYFYKDLS